MRRAPGQHLWSALGRKRHAGSRLPSPGTSAVLGHLPRWTSDPLSLLEEGAERGPLFDLALWRKATVGYLPDWNRLLLGDLVGFRSRGSLSQLSPYLSAGVVATEAPAHRHRRAELNPAFHRSTVHATFTDGFAEVVRRSLPVGQFEAADWASAVVRSLLVESFVGPAFPRRVLESFLAPLERPLPGPLLRRPIRIHRMNTALRAAFDDPASGTLAEHFAGLDGGVEEARVALAAAYDTTAHTLAFGLWELAGRPELNDRSVTRQVVQETLRLYPAGWIGSRIASRDTPFQGVTIPTGRLVLYSPLLTHRSPAVWRQPLAFRPERFAEPIPAWGYIPFAAGERTCLGAHLATLMLRTAIGAFAGSTLTRVSGDASPRGVLTLTPGQRLLLRRSA